jgi:hypothetical protein
MHSLSSIQIFCLFSNIAAVLKYLFHDSSHKDEDELAEYLRNKYADEGTVARHFGDGGEEMSDEITQQTLLPGVK